jgi:hypothetical protein
MEVQDSRSTLAKLWYIYFSTPQQHLTVCTTGNCWFVLVVRGHLMTVLYTESIQIQKQIPYIITYICIFIININIKQQLHWCWVP